MLVYKRNLSTNLAASSNQFPMRLHAIAALENRPPLLEQLIWFARKDSMFTPITNGAMRGGRVQKFANSNYENFAS